MTVLVLVQPLAGFLARAQGRCSIVQDLYDSLSAEQHAAWAILCICPYGRNHADLAACLSILQEAWSLGP